MEFIVVLVVWLTLLALVHYSRTDTMRILSLYFYGVLLFIPIVCFSALVWTFKDGIAPDEGYSEGWQAWSLFFQGIWEFALIVTGFVVAGYFVNRRARKRIAANQEVQGSVQET